MSVVASLLRPHLPYHEEDEGHALRVVRHQVTHVLVLLGGDGGGVQDDREEVNLQSRQYQ